VKARLADGTDIGLLRRGLGIGDWGLGIRGIGEMGISRERYG